MDDRGYGMSSVRFICGCQDIHKELSRYLQVLLRYWRTLSHAACFDANGGSSNLYSPQRTLSSPIVSIMSNIDLGVRLCKAKRYRYANGDMADLEEQLKAAQSDRFRIIVTDGVFSADGNVAPMDKICDLAEKYDALVMVDECHSLVSWGLLAAE